MICPICGTVFDDRMAVCPKCGAAPTYNAAYPQAGYALPPVYGQTAGEYISKEDYYDFAAPPEVRKYPRTAWILYLVFTCISVVLMIGFMVIYIMDAATYIQPDYAGTGYPYMDSEDMFMTVLTGVYLLLTRIAIYLLGFFGIRKRRIPLCVAYLITTCAFSSLICLPSAICALVCIRRFNQAYEAHCAGQPVYPPVF